MMGGQYPLYFFDVYFVTDVDECTNSSLYSCPTNHSKCINEMGSYRCGCDEGYRKLWSSEYRDQDISCIGEYSKEILLDDMAGQGLRRGKKGGKREGVGGTRAF